MLFILNIILAIIFMVTAIYILHSAVTKRSNGISFALILLLFLIGDELIMVALMTNKMSTYQQIVGILLGLSFFPVFGLLIYALKKGPNNDNNPEI